MPFPAHCFLLLENQLLSGSEFVGKYLQIGIDPAQKRDGDFALISALFYEHIVFLTFRPDCAGRDMEDMVGMKRTTRTFSPIWKRWCLRL